MSSAGAEATLSELFTSGAETSDKELAAWGKRYIPGFKGVRAKSAFTRLFPNDKPIPLGASCILNLDRGDYERGGTHWVAVRRSTEVPALLYVDSFGITAPREVICRGRMEGLPVIYPDVQHQGIDEVNCGPRALAVLYTLADAAKSDEEMEVFGEIGR